MSSLLKYNIAFGKLLICFNRLFDNELDYVSQLIEEDIRNNSAWNQRYFVIKHATNFHPDVITTEIEYTINKIKIVPKNESPWNYLRG